MGKLIMALIGAVLLLAASPSGARAEDVDLALVLAVDVSGSVDEDEYRLQRQGYADAFLHPAVVSAIRSTGRGRIAATYIQWAGYGYQRISVPWTVVSDEASAAAFSDQIARAPRARISGTSISGAIDFSVLQLSLNPHATVRRVIDVSGDGVNNSGRPPDLARDAALALDIAINGLVIMNDNPGPGWQGYQPPLDEHYRDHVIGGPGAFVLAVDGFESFAHAILNKLIREISAIPPATRVAFDRPGIRIMAAPARAASRD
jgi:hypothetical protein